MTDNIKVFQPNGNLDGTKGNQLRQEITASVENGANVILVDLQDVAFMDSSALGLLLSALKSVKASGAKFFICSVSQQVKMLFELTKMERIFHIFASRDEFNQAILSAAE